jgi:hypothetical protein
MRRAGRHIAARSAGGLADEELRPAHGRSRDPRPDRGPAQVGDGRHCLRMDLFVCHGKYLVRGAPEIQLEAGAAGPTHAERLPPESGLQRIFVTGDGQ